jgi:hypothetical protein
MPSEDTELTALAVVREIAGHTRDREKARHDRCFERLILLHSKHNARIDRLSRKGDDLHRAMGDAYSRSKECFSCEDHAGAGEWSAQGKALEAKLSEVNGKKNRKIAKLKAAQAEFEEAREDYLSAKVAHETAHANFCVRLDHLERLAKERTEAQARRRAANAQPERVGDTVRFKELAVLKAKREFQFRDEDVKVRVKDGYSRDFDVFVTDIIVSHRDPSITKHVHVIYDVDGNERLSEYHDDPLA